MELVSTSPAECRTLDRGKIEHAVRLLLEAIGEDPDREGLLDTPRRVANYLAEATSGLRLDACRHLARVFHEEHEEMVVVRGIPFHSICEHHLLPFVGKAHVIYIPNRGRVVGLSKLARLVEDFARRPQLQERLTSQVADAIMSGLSAQGAMVLCEAEHLCMTIRGVKKAGSTTVTSAVRGIFRQDHAARTEALYLVKGG